MARNRVIYASEALFVGTSPATGVQYSAAAPIASENRSSVVQLNRIQSCNYNYSINRIDVNQFGELAAIDRVLLDPPTVTLDFSYLNQSFFNEYTMGFAVNSGSNNQTSCLSGILDRTQEDRNYFLKVSDEGVDAIGDRSTSTSGTSRAGYIGFGNGFISNYRTEGSVGNFPTTSITIDALNLGFFRALGASTGIIHTGFLEDGSVAIDTPAVDPTNGNKVTGYVSMPLAKSNPSGAAGGQLALSVLRPGDISFSFTQNGTVNAYQEGGATITDLKIQSYNISLGLQNEDIKQLGSKYSFSKEPRFPINVQMTVDAVLGDVNTGNLVDMLSGNGDFDCKVTIKHPTASPKRDQMVWQLRKAKLDGQSFTSSIGQNKSVTMTFTSQVGSTNQTGVGLFMSGQAINNTY